MKNIILVLSSLFISFQVTSQITEKYISTDSPILLSFKNSEISGKIDEGMLNSLEIYQNLTKETKELLTSYLKAIILNDKSTGISNKGNSYVTFDFNDSLNIVQFIIPMGNKVNFETTAKDYRSMEEIHSTSSQFKILKKTYGDMAIAYNEEVIILSNIDVKYQYIEKKGSEKFGYNNTYSNTGESNVTQATEMVLEEIITNENGVETHVYAEIEEDTPKRDYQLERHYKDSLSKVIQLEYLQSSFKTNSNLSGDFLALTQKTYDIGFYMDYATMYDSFLKEAYSNMGMRSVMNNYNQMLEMMNSLYSETKVFGELNFEDDQISVKSSFVADTETMNAMKNVLDAKVNKNILKYIKSDSLVSVVSGAVNVEAYADFYEHTIDKIFESYTNKDDQVEMMKDAFDVLTTLFIDEEELYDLLKGDMVFTFNSIRNFDYEYEYRDYYSDTTIMKTRTVTQPIFSMMSSMGNKKLMDKVMNIVRKSGLFIESGDYFMTKEIIEKEIGDLYLAYKNGILFFTNDISLMKNLNSGFPKSQQLSKVQQKKVLENNTYAFFDADTMITSVSGMFSERERPTANILAQRLGLIELYGAKIENGALTSTMTMDIEGEQNSLMNVLLMIHEMYESTKR